MLTRYGSMLFAIPPIILLVFYGLELGTVSDCIAAGGHYDFTTENCSDTPVETLSFYQRHRGLADLSLLLSAFGALMMTWGMLKKGMTPKDGPDDA